MEIASIHNLQHRHQSWIMKQRRLSSQQSHSRREGDNLSGLSPSLEPSQQYQTLTASDGKVLCQTAGTDFSDNSANQTLSQLNSRDGVLSGFDRDQQHLETVGHDAIALSIPNMPSSSQILHHFCIALIAYFDMNIASMSLTADWCATFVNAGNSKMYAFCVVDFWKVHKTNWKDRFSKNHECKMPVLKLRITRLFRICRVADWKFSCLSI